MLSFTTDQAEELIKQGFEPGWLNDIEVGCTVVVAPLLPSFAEKREMKRYRVVRLLQEPRTELDDDEPVSNVVINFIGIGESGVPEHLSYGYTYPCFFKKG